MTNETQTNAAGERPVVRLTAKQIAVILGAVGALISVWAAASALFANGLHEQSDRELIKAVIDEERRTFTPEEVAEHDLEQDRIRGVDSRVTAVESAVETIGTAVVKIERTQSTLVEAVQDLTTAVETKAP